MILCMLNILNYRPEIYKKKKGNILIKYYFFIDPYDACLEEQDQIGEFVFKIENQDIRDIDKSYYLNKPKPKISNNSNNSNNNIISNNNMGNKINHELEKIKDLILPLPLGILRNSYNNDNSEENQNLSEETKKSIKLIKSNTKLANVNIISIYY